MTDKELEKHISEAAYQPADHSWFTRKVVNRLPRRRVSRASKVMTVTYALAALAVIGGWIIMILKTDFSSLAGLLSMVAMSAITVAVFLKAALR